MLELAGRKAPTLSIATVYRALKKLSDDGSICPVALAGEPVRYKAAWHGHHHHFQCSRCRRVYDVAGRVDGLGGLVRAMVCSSDQSASGLPSPPPRQHPLHTKVWPSCPRCHFPALERADSAQSLGDTSA